MDQDTGTETKPQPARKKGRTGRIVRALAPWVVSGGIILYIIATEDMAQVARSFGKGDALIFASVTVPFLVALLLLESFYLLLGFKWFAGVGNFSDLLRARAATYFATVINIFVGLGGLVVYGKRKYGISYSMGTSVMLNELLHELASQCTLALMIGLLLPIALIPDQALPQVKGVMMVGMIGVGFYALCIITSRLSRYIPEDWPKIEVLDRFAHIHLWQYAVFYLVKLVQNILYGLFLMGLFLSFGMKPPLIACLAFMQIIHLTRAIPISAFGIGIDQIAFPVLFGAWEPQGSPGLVLALSIVFTFTMVLGRALLGVPFIKGVFNDLVDKEDMES